MALGSRVKVTQSSLAGEPQELVDATAQQVHNELLRVIKFSADGKYFVAGGDDKRVSLWDTSTFPFTFVGALVVEKKVTGIAMPPAPAPFAVVVSDRFGNVFSFDHAGFAAALPYPAYNGSSAKQDNSLYLLVGMYSWISDLEVGCKVASDGSQSLFILSPTRDEKMQVANFPNGYDIASYCMGHTEYMSSVVDVGKGFAVSAGGDGNLFVWNYTEGKSVQQIQHQDKAINFLAYSSATNILAFVCEGDPTVFVYTYNQEETSLKKHKTITVSSPPLHLAFTESTLLVALSENVVKTVDVASGEVGPSLTFGEGGIVPVPSDADSQVLCAISKYETTSKSFLQAKIAKKRKLQ
eukprot:TRINITY_DN3996_c0_g1_i1.p1 TRINITY_DN3996_c0_g1~~TRINITY_DN3996_c0_g1_i1.p1  ORF type:complete len:379 (+),score=60.84 TRINITY_DN3996_c0_g1_i1:79-1137(+)